MHIFFNEPEYFGMYPDVAEAVAKGIEDSGIGHYVRTGKAEGRRGYRFDDDWYATCYPLAVTEVSSGLTPSLMDHYENYGRARGYLPHAKAPRPDNPTAIPSAFGGLWIDQPNSRDIVAGRLETGMITREQADLLLAFIENGYVVIKQGVTSEEIDRALEDLERAYRGEIDNLVFECADLGHVNSPWQSEFMGLPSKALDIHWWSSAIRDLILSAKVTDFLHLIFDAKASASQTLGFYRGSAQHGHQDSAYVPYTLQRGFAASWIALEDVSPNAGELFYFRGSHRLPDFYYGGQFKSTFEAYRNDVPREIVNTDVRTHIDILEPSSEAAGMRKETFLAKRGDVLIWHADLIHGGCPISSEQSRRSVVTHYSSKFTRPLFAESYAVPMHDHNGKGFFTTLHYPGTDFV